MLKAVHCDGHPAARKGEKEEEAEDVGAAAVLDGAVKLWVVLVLLAVLDFVVVAVKRFHTVAAPAHDEALLLTYKTALCIVCQKATKMGGRLPGRAVVFTYAVGGTGTTTANQGIAPFHDISCSSIIYATAWFFFWQKPMPMPS
jgi:hypothetical protein